MNHFTKIDITSSFDPQSPPERSSRPFSSLPAGDGLGGITQESRFFSVEPHTQLQGFCHWQSDRKVSPRSIVHGLEGSSESQYIRGIAVKAYRAGFNVIRMNQRTCGGTEHLTPTLYNSGLSEDYRTILNELAHRDGLNRIWLIGYSMGGNLVLKAGGELGKTEPALAGIAAVCPNINPTICARALEEPRNFIYHRHFLTRLKSRLRKKAALLPGKWDLSQLDRIATISEFDDRYTAHDGGYRDGADYYNRAGARHVLDAIAVPTIITAQDDPFHSLLNVYRTDYSAAPTHSCGRSSLWRPLRVFTEAKWRRPVLGGEPNRRLFAGSAMTDAAPNLLPEQDGYTALRGLRGFMAATRGAHFHTQLRMSQVLSATIATMKTQL